MSVFSFSKSKHCQFSVFLQLGNSALHLKCLNPPQGLWAVLLVMDAVPAGRGVSGLN